MKLKSISVTRHSSKLFLLLVLLWGQLTFAQQDLSLREDLTFRLITVTDAGQVNIPTEFADYQTVGLFVLKDEEFDVLRFCNDDPFDIWINSKLYFVDESCIDLSKQDIIQKSALDSLYFVLHTDGDFAGIQAGIFTNDLSRTVIYYPVKARPITSNNTLLITFFLSLFLVVGLIKHFLPSLHRDLYRISYMSSTQDRSNEFDQKILVLSILLSLLAGFSYWYFFDFSVEGMNDTFSRGVLQWLGYSGLIFIALVLKYIFISWIARLNSFRHLPYNQVYDFLKFFIITSVILMMILFVKYWFNTGGQQVDGWFWRNYYIFAYIAFLIYYFYKLAFGLRYKKLHIISYLCTTEFLGVLLIALIFTN